MSHTNITPALEAPKSIRGIASKVGIAALHRFVVKQHNIIPICASPAAIVYRASTIASASSIAAIVLASGALLSS